ncbi:hypothetical protein [Clostridium sp.]|uniref:hypothetical protein n=1 Tax=Clostridium sp. TaxID=1506 RepID=UPI002617F008|nr:hypothetical protein [Clostridium sp.]
MCYDEGIFQQIIDGEYEGNIEKVKDHIANCEECKRKFEELQSTEIFMNEKLNKEFRIAETRKIDLEYQLLKFYKKEKGRSNMNPKVRKLAAAAAALTIVIGTMSYQPVRIKAAELLNVFRVNNVTGISITENNINKIERALEKGEGNVDLKDFISADVKSEEKPINLSETEISKETVKKYKEDAELIPINDSLKYSYMTIRPECDLTLKFNVPKVNDFLEYLGENTKLPKEIDQKEFIIHCGKSVSYGINSKNSEKEGKHINVTQVGTPTLTLPEGVDQKQMINILLSLNLLPQNVKEQLASIGDLSTTLPVPYLEDKSTKTDITIKGQKAVLIESKDAEIKDSNVIFKKGDSLFVVSAEGYSSDELTKLLETME